MRSRIFLSPPHLVGTEERFLRDALESNWIAPLGPHVDAFEQELAGRAGAPYAVALSSGTAALHLALEVLGVGRGDEVFCSTLTFAASANAIRYTGAEPVFIDSERQSWTMDADLLGEELERRARQGRLPKAVLVVDIYGQCADYDTILGHCRRYEIPVIEDAAEALGATYKERPAGALADLGVFSFNGNKIITTSGGGALLSVREDWASRVRFLATQARDPAPHYEHSSVGYNYRLSNLLAAVGRSQLEVLDQRVARRREINHFYREALGHLPGIELMPEAVWGRSTFWLTCILVDASRFGADREAIRTHLDRCDIEARPVWKPMHLQPVFAAHPSVGGEVAAELFERGLCLPSGSSMTDDDLRRVVDAVIAVHHAAVR